MIRWIAATALALTLTFGASVAQAGDVVCAPNLGPVTVDGNVIVRNSCTLAGTVVKGNVLVQPGGILIARYADVDGNVQADAARRVVLRHVAVKGDVQLKGTTASGDTSIDNSFVGGNVQMESNRSPLLVVQNFVDGDVQAFSNRGGVRIGGNTIGGNLQCKSNVPAPIGGGNVVGGNKEDQCRSF